jgi:hypothetical protein
MRYLASVAKSNAFRGWIILQMSQEKEHRRIKFRGRFPPIGTPIDIHCWAKSKFLQLEADFALQEHFTPPLITIHFA